jgi:N-acetylneuraminate synthase/sialic acid synthase
MGPKFTIGDKVITQESVGYVIAELGHNHQGDIEKCKAMIRAAAQCGADAVKLQKRDNRALFTREMYESAYHSENAYAPTYGAHREKLEFSKDQYRELMDFADETGIFFFSTAFDRPSADLLEEIGMRAYKIASGDLTNTPLLRHVASFGKPMIISTGGATMADVQRAYDVISPINRNFCILQCTSGYPSPYEELNLRTIETFSRAFPDVVIGLSGHDAGISMPPVAYMLGARVFEKHFTLNRTWKGTDQAFSLEPGGLRRVVRDLQRTHDALGTGQKVPYESESKPLNKMTKRIVAARDLDVGTVLTEADLDFRIPVEEKITANALPPYWLDYLVGKTLKRAVKSEEIIGFDEIGEARH